MLVGPAHDTDRVAGTLVNIEGEVRGQAVGGGVIDYLVSSGVLEDLGQGFGIDGAGIAINLATVIIPCRKIQADIVAHLVEEAGIPRRAPEPMVTRTEGHRAAVPDG